MVKMNSEMREIIEKQPYVVLATISANKLPHLIVVKDRWVINDEMIVFSRWQMVQTGENLKNNPIVSILAVDPEKRRSIRFFGEGAFMKKSDLPLSDGTGKSKEFLAVKITRIQYGQWGKDTNIEFSYDETWKGKLSFKRGDQ